VPSAPAARSASIEDDDIADASPVSGLSYGDDMTTADPAVLDWLLNADPAIRWQVLRDFTDATDTEIAAERAKVATDGWGGRLLAARDADGQWAGGACFPADFRGDFSAGQPWTSTLPTLDLLVAFGLEPQSPQARKMIALVRDNCRWEHDGQAFFDGEVEPCINGRIVAIGSYFGVDVEGIVKRLLGERLADGGWNCEAENGSVRSSFHTTICVLEGLAEYERAGTAMREVAEARREAEEYLLERRLWRRLSTGEAADADWLSFSFPTRWHYDVLRGLDYFRASGRGADDRMAEAVELVRSKRQADGRWLLENTHLGKVHFPLEEGDGAPSRWNTLRAQRVLDCDDQR
jgi:hypothetical protein